MAARIDSLSERDGGPPTWATSVDVWVMLRPRAAYEWLAASPSRAGKWIVLRRPLALAFLLACMMSLVASQRLTLRHIAGGTVSALFLLLAQVGVLWLVCGRRRTIPFARTVDLFFASYGPWVLWVLAFSYLWAFLPMRDALKYFWTGSITVTGGTVVAWSLYLDCRFFRGVFHRSRAGAAWDVARLWTLSWCVCLVIFGWSALPAEVARILAR